MAITTILSDLGNVVVAFDNGITYRTFASIAGVPPKAVEDAMFAKEADGSYLIARYSSGLIGSEDFRQEFLLKLGIRPSVVPEAWFMRSFCDVFTPIRPVVDLWRRLHRRGITMTAVSNVEELRHLWLRRIGIMDLFDHEVVSYEEGLLKPSEEFMVRALDRSGAQAEEAVFVDDLEPNLGPAAAIGIHTHCYRGYDQLVEFLKGLGLPAR